MKKTLLWLSALLMLLPAASCKNDEVTVYPEPAEKPHLPIMKDFYVVDADGNDLIRGGWVRTSDVYALYRGQKYPLNKDFNTNFNENVTLHGLMITNEKGPNGLYKLSFGELDSATDYINETISLYWSDGSIDTYTFSENRTWNRLTGQYDEYSSWMLNAAKNPVECRLEKTFLTRRGTPDGYMVPMEWYVNDQPLSGTTIDAPASGATYLLVCDNYPTFDWVKLYPEADWIAVSQINNKLVLTIEPMSGSDALRSCQLQASYNGFSGELTIQQKK